MKVQELKDILVGKGFDEEKLDTGYNYRKVIDHIELVCYIEPQIDIAFISLYKWNNNEVKGVYKASLIELSRVEKSVQTFFEKTLDDMPLYIGSKINLHSEVKAAIDSTFQ